jgi:hypothetical protein
VITNAAGVLKEKDYYDLGFVSLFELSQATLGLTIAGFLAALTLFVCQFFYQLGKVSPTIRLSTSFLRTSWVAGILSTIAYGAAVITYCFWNHAYSQGSHTMCVTVPGLCNSFVGSSGSVYWGPFVGWAAAVCATACALVSVLIFLVASKKERDAEAIEHLLVNG